jgi:ribosomal protein S27E
MSRSRGGSGASVRGPLREIVAVLATADQLGSRFRSSRRKVRLECGHEPIIESHSTTQARCLLCLPAVKPAPTGKRESNLYCTGCGHSITHHLRDGVWGPCAISSCSCIAALAHGDPGPSGD